MLNERRIRIRSQINPVDPDPQQCLKSGRVFFIIIEKRIYGCTFEKNILLYAIVLPSVPDPE